MSEHYGRAPKNRRRPRSVLEWEDDGNQIVVQRASRFSSEDIHRALFGARTPKTHSIDEMKEGVRRYARRRYARH